MNRHLQPSAPRAEQPTGRLDSPYLTLEEGARHCRFDTCQHPTTAFRKWMARQGVPVVRRGRVLLVERRVLDAMLHDSDSEGGSR